MVGLADGMDVMPAIRRVVWIGLLALTPVRPAAAETAEAQIEILVLDLGRGAHPRVDPRLAEREPLLQMLSRYNRIQVIERVDARLSPREEVTVEFATPAAQKAKLRVRLLERTAESMKLRVRCPALQDLDTVTTHQAGGTFVVVRPQSSVGVAIRRVRPTDPPEPP